MNISATNCSPIKPNFKGSQSDVEYQQVLRATDQLEDNFISSSEIKTPVQTIASVTLAGLVAFVSGKKIASVISKVAKNAPEQVENGLRKSANFIKEKATNLASTEASTKSGKAKHFVGSALSKLENTARTAYKKVAYIGAKEGASVADKANVAFQNLAGTLGVASILPNICRRDTNEDGIADISQKNHNVYTGTKNKFNNVISATSQIADVIESLT